jgi:Zn-dependent peptidase ImmA (M78 family)
MRDDVFVYVTEDLPDAIHSACVPCADGYNIYINANLDEAHRQIAYLHELIHIEHGHCERDIDVNKIEGELHG